MFYRALLRFAIEAIQKFGLNVVGFYLEMGERRWYIIRCYLAPNNTSSIESVVAALRQRPWGTKLLVARDFNMDLAQPEGVRRDKEIADALVADVLEDMSAHFLLVRCSWC